MMGDGFISAEAFDRASLGRWASAWYRFASIGRRKQVADGPVVVTAYRTVTGKVIVIRISNHTAVLDKGEPERCPTCGSDDPGLCTVGNPHPIRFDLGMCCSDPWHGGTDDQ